MTDDAPKQDQPLRDHAESGKLMNGRAAIRRSAMLAAERRVSEESRVPPLSDFTAEANPQPVLTEQNDASSDRQKSTVDPARPVADDASDHLGKKS